MSDWELIADIADHLGAPTEVQDAASLLKWLRERPEAPAVSVVMPPGPPDWAPSALAGAINWRDREWLDALAAAGIAVKSP